MFQYNKMLAAPKRTAIFGQTIWNPAMPEKHCPNLHKLVNTTAHTWSFRHMVVCLPDSAQSCQNVIIPELDSLHGPSSHRGQPGPGLIFTPSPTSTPCPSQQYSPSSSECRNGHEYPQPPSSIGGISTANVNLWLPLSRCLAPQRLHFHIVKYSFPSIVGIITHPAANNPLHRTASPPVSFVVMRLTL